MTAGPQSHAEVEVSEYETHAINEAIEILKEYLPNNYPFEKVRKRLTKLLLASKLATAGKAKRHGNSGNFKQFYLPLIEELHTANPGHQWTFSEMAGCLIAYLENDPTLVPDKNRLTENTLRKQRLPKYADDIASICGLTFVSKAPIDQSSAKLPK